MTLQFHVLSGLCKACLTCSHPKVEDAKVLFCVRHFEAITFLYTILLSHFLYHIKHKLLVPTFKVTDSLSLSSCHLSLPYQEVTSFYDASFHLPLDQQISSS